MRVIPPCVTKWEVKSKKAQISTRVMEEEEVLKGDTKCINLIEASMYDTKPFHYTSTVS